MNEVKPTEITQAIRLARFEAFSEAVEACNAVHAGCRDSFARSAASRCLSSIEELRSAAKPASADNKTVAHEVENLLKVVGATLDWTAREAPHMADADRLFPWWRSLQAAQRGVVDALRTDPCASDTRPRLPINEDDQAMVDRLMRENRPKATTKTPLAQVAGKWPGDETDAELQRDLNVAKDGVIWHHMPSPGVAGCGADYPNMSKTAAPTNVTCLDCLHNLVRDTGDAPHTCREPRTAMNTAPGVGCQGCFDERRRSEAASPVLPPERERARRHYAALIVARDFIEGGSFEEKEPSLNFIYAALRDEPEPRTADDQHGPTITLPLSRIEDTEVTCLYCRHPQPCEYGLTIRRDGETALVGLHAVCLEPFRKKQRRERGPNDEQAAKEERSALPATPASGAVPTVERGASAPVAEDARGEAHVVHDVPADDAPRAPTPAAVTDSRPYNKGCDDCMGFGNLPNAETCACGLPSANENGNCAFAMSMHPEGVPCPKCRPGTARKACAVPGNASRKEP